MRHGRRHALLLLLPSLVLLLLLFYLPQLLMLGVSLGRRTAYGGVERAFSAASYLRALEPLYLGILWRSVLLAAVTTLVCLLAAYPVAYWLARRVSPRYRTALLALTATAVAYALLEPSRRPWAVLALTAVVVAGTAMWGSARLRTSP